ncbi:hypothetical protein GLA29479_1064 [Lysobacter antibioticus]|nr:hypothetical protein GLA29479_1064 [Lysobacter antibioticus]
MQWRLRIEMRDERCGRRFDPGTVAIGHRRKLRFAARERCVATSLRRQRNLTTESLRPTM